MLQTLAITMLQTRCIFFSKLLLIIAGTKALIDRDDHSQRMYRFFHLIRPNKTSFEKIIVLSKVVTNSFITARCDSLQWQFIFKVLYL